MKITTAYIISSSYPFSFRSVNGLSLDSRKPATSISPWVKANCPKMVAWYRDATNPTVLIVEEEEG